MSNDACTQIRTFITTKFPDVTFSDEEDIFALGFVNSLFAMELVMFIEKAFGTRIPNEELHLGNFRSVSLMADLVARQTSAAVG